MWLLQLCFFSPRENLTSLSLRFIICKMAIYAELSWRRNETEHRPGSSYLIIKHRWALPLPKDHVTPLLYLPVGNKVFLCVVESLSKNRAAVLYPTWSQRVAISLDFSRPEWSNAEMGKNQCNVSRAREVIRRKLLMTKHSEILNPKGLWGWADANFSCSWVLQSLGWTATAIGSRIAPKQSQTQYLPPPRDRRLRHGRGPQGAELQKAISLPASEVAWPPCDYTK